MQLVVFSIGSNLGDRRNNITLALKELAKYGFVAAVSSVYESAAAGFISNNRFYNVCAVMQITRTGLQWKQILLDIEEKLGRVRTGRPGDRVIDIDILFFHPHAEGSEGLEVPHPRMAGRDFVVFPLCDVIHSVNDTTWQKKTMEWKAGLESKSDIYCVGSL